MRKALAAIAVLALPAVAAGQECMVSNNMMICRDGAMAFNFQTPPTPFAPGMSGFMRFYGMNAATPGATQWRMSQSVNADGSRLLHMETMTRRPDGSVERQVENRIVFPNGQSCRVAGDRLLCE